MSFGYNVYFSDRYNNRILSYSPDLDGYEVLIGNEKKEESPLSQPYGIVTSPTGELIITDMFNHRICKLVDKELSVIETYTPDRHRDRCRFAYHKNFPWAPAGIFREENGNLLVSYSDDGTIYRIYPDGKLELVLGIPPSKAYTLRKCHSEVSPEDIARTPLFTPAGIVAKKDGTIFFIERGWGLVRQYHPEKGLHSLFPYELQKKFSRTKDTPAFTTIDEYFSPYPMALVLDGENTLFLADLFHRCTYEIDLVSRNMTKVFFVGEQEKGPYGLALGKDNTLWAIIKSDEKKSIVGYKKQERSWRKIVDFSIPNATIPNCDGIGGMGMATK